MDSFETEIDRQIDAALEGSEGRHLVYRVNLSGRGPLHSLVKEQEYLEELATRLNDDWSLRNPFAYCDRVTANTRQEIDRDDLLERDDFTGDLLRFFEESRGNEAVASELQESLNQLYQHRRLRKFISDRLPQGDELAALVDDAESICLDLLIGEGIDEN